MIAFRADANDTIGSGHLMRCMSIASAMVKKYIEVVFIVADENSNLLVKERGFSSIVLNTSWNRIDDEINIMQNIIENKDITVLIIDSYYVTESYLRILRNITKTVYIDDIDAMMYPVDVLINYNINADEFDYEKRYSSANYSTRFLLGTSFIPLRLEFSNRFRENELDCDKVYAYESDLITDVIITSGASDSRNIMTRLIREIRQCEYYNNVNGSNIKFHIVIGAYNVHADEVIDMVHDDKRFVIYQNVTRISDIMLRCNAAISAGGSTMYELCACRVPTICYTFADNQFGLAKRFDNDGLAVYVGDDRDKNGIQGEAVKALIKLCVDGDKRSKMIEKIVRRKMDRGVDNIVREITKYDV